MNKRFIILIFLILLLVNSTVIIHSDSNVDEIGAFNFDETSTCKKINQNDDDIVSKSIVSDNNVSFFDDFTNKSSYELFKKYENKNIIYSPLSLYYTISMLCEGASDEYKEEFYNVLGINEINDEFRDYLYKVLNNNNFYKTFATTRLTNGLWLNNSAKLNSAYGDILTKYYNADIFSTSFSDEDNEIMERWSSHYTGGLIKNCGLNISGSMLENMNFIMLSMMYFNQKWFTKFDKVNNYRDLFNEKNNVEYMKHTSVNNFYVDENYTMVENSFGDSDKASTTGYIRYYIPSLEYLNNHNLSDLFEENIINNSKTSSKANITLSVPKIHVEMTVSLDNTLKNLGLKSVYNYSSGINYFDQMATLKSENSPSYLATVEQLLYFELAENGVKAAAISRAYGCGKASDEPLENVQIIINRPFIFEVCGQYFEPLFVGMINEIKN